MASLFREYSLFVRRRRAAKECERVLAKFQEGCAITDALAAASPIPGKLLVVRLDDIGDYLLFRNQLAMYKKSERWQRHTITLLGNAAWREIHTLCDADSVDGVIWVDKGKYLADASYRSSIWQQLRAQQFETVIAPARTRPLLLDDLCMRAAAPVRSLGAVNSFVHDSWNRISDELYSELFPVADAPAHEFHFNARFAAWACGICYEGTRPTIDPSLVAPQRGAHILCFVGANTRSKRWPAKRWIEFIRAYRRRHSDTAVVAGAGAVEIDIARRIHQETGARSIAGEVSLLELLEWIAGATAVVTNDTMAAHLAASCRRPTLIIANGVNHTRFTDYAKAGISGVATVYPDVFHRRRQRFGDIDCNYEDVVTADIASIEASTALTKFEEILGDDADPAAAHALPREGKYSDACRLDPG